MIAEAIFDWARRTPEKTAVLYNERPWSYRSFAGHIASARTYFLKRGFAGPGYAVLATHNRMDFWILSLALRSLGLTTVAVGSAAMLAELSLSDIRCVIARDGEAWPNLANTCQARGLTLLSVSVEDDLPPEAVPFLPPDEPGGHILLTSGTTGRFKMLLSTPAIDANFLRWRTEITGLNQNSVQSVFSFEPWTAAGYRSAANAWLVGGTTLMEHGREPYRALLNPGITHAVIVPVLLDPILAAPANAYPRNDAMQLSVTGGAMTRRQIEQTKARITTRIVSWLGSTEISAFACTPLETEEDQRWHRLLPHRVVEIVSDAGDPVPMGEVGRVRISTKDSATGYLGDEETTKLHFKDGYFYPGDLAVARSDGRIALQGRSTDVINIKGKKIFPGPIESRLCEALNVSGACLVSMHNERGEDELHIAIETAVPIGAERLRDAINAALRAYPRTHIVCVPSLPRNQMGKVVRQAVRDRIAASLSPRTSPSAPGKEPN
jgi:fatty-acyl-CoA synthase/long-chain acyl-CoA synthetase